MPSEHLYVVLAFNAWDSVTVETPLPLTVDFKPDPAEFGVGYLCVFDSMDAARAAFPNHRVTVMQGASSAD